MIKPNNNIKVFSEIYDKVYDWYDSSHCLLQDIKDIFNKNSDISTIEISEMINYALVLGARACRNKTSAIDRFTLDYPHIYKLLDKLVDYPLTTNEVDLILSKFGSYARHDDHEWITKLINNGYIVTAAQKKKLASYNYFFPLKSEFAGNENVTVQHLMKYIKSNGVINKIMQDKDFFVDLIKKNKIVVTFQMYLIFLRECTWVDTNSFDIIKLFDKCAYIFTIKDLLIGLSYRNQNLTDNSFKQLIEFVNKKKLNEKQFILETMFVIKAALDYLVRNDKLDMIPQDVAITCAILHSDLNVIKYYTNKKYIATQKELIFSLYVRTNNSLIFDHFIKTGSVISLEVFKATLFVDTGEKYEHLLVGVNNLKKDELKKKVQIIIKSCNSVTRSYNSTKQKIISASTQKSESILEEICAKNELVDILAYMKMYDMSINSSCIDGIFHNSHINVAEYFKFKYNLKPSLSSIILNPDMSSRYFSTMIYYPELVNVEHDLGLIVEIDKRDKIEAPIVETNEVNEEKNKKVSKRVTKNSKAKKVFDDVDFESVNSGSEDEVLVKKSKKSKVVKKSK